MGVLPGAEPFAADGGEVGVVLSHGFTGTSQRLRPWAEHLAALDHDAPAIFAGSPEFAHAPTTTPAAG